MQKTLLKEDPIPGLKPLYTRLNKAVMEKIIEQKQDKRYENTWTRILSEPMLCLYQTP